MYRIRPLDYILGEEYQELEKQQIYFTPFDELNDPLEGTIDMFWQGDLIVWENFLCHYLLCLCNKFLRATFSNNANDFLKEKEIHVQMTVNNLPERYGEVFKQIKKHFLSKQEIIVLLDYLSNKQIPTRRNELLFYLQSINLIALHSIISVHRENKLCQGSNFLSLLQEEESSLVANITTLKEANSEENTKELFRHFNLLYKQSALLQYYNFRTEKFDKKLAYLLINFPEDFSMQIDELVYSKWYLACFMNSCPNASLWGSYGVNHTGVCLKFKTYNNDNKIYLPIEMPVGFGSNGLMIEPSEMFFDKVEYGNDRIQVDFFRSILTLPTPVLHEEWYTDDAGLKSICSDVLEDKEKRRKYWDNQKRISTSKTLDWKEENEYRLILTPLLDEFSNKEDRVLKYNFNDLDGIIFGMRTPIEDKVKILAILDKKCQEHKRDDFKIYQADYDFGKKEMIIDELELIKPK